MSILVRLRMENIFGSCSLLLSPYPVDLPMMGIVCARGGTVTGPKVAMYFAWIGYYTFHLWLPTLLGLIVGILRCAMTSPVFAVLIHDGVHNFPLNSLRLFALGSMATQQSVSESDPGKPQWDNVISPVYAFFMIIWGLFALLLTFPRLLIAILTPSAC